MEYIYICPKCRLIYRNREDAPNQCSNCKVETVSLDYNDKEWYSLSKSERDEIKASFIEVPFAQKQYSSIEHEGNTQKQESLIEDEERTQKEKIPYHANVLLKKNKKEELFIVEPIQTGSASSASVFCKVLGVLTWIGGLIIAISAGSVASPYGSEFNFIAFLTPCITYGIVGGVMFCLAELFQNIKSIADSLKGMSVLGNKDALNQIHRNNESSSTND